MSTAASASGTAKPLTFPSESCRTSYGGLKCLNSLTRSAEAIGFSLQQELNT